MRNFDESFSFQSYFQCLITDKLFITKVEKSISEDVKISDVNEKSKKSEISMSESSAIEDSDADTDSTSFESSCRERSLEFEKRLLKMKLNVEISFEDLLTSNFAAKLSDTKEIEETDLLHDSNSIESFTLNIDKM